MARKGNPQDELDVEQLAQAELSRLQRQYRIMEGERETYSQETAFLLQKQRSMISILEGEKRDLLTNLQASKSTANERKNIELEKKIIKQLATLDKLESHIKVETSQTEELDAEIAKMEKEVRKLRLKDITDAQSAQKAVENDRNISGLENRLHVVTTRFNEMLAENGKLRQEIDHLLKERAHFNLLYQQLISRLNTGKKIMLDLIEQATLAYDQREEAQSKLHMLKERGRQDMHIHSQEMRELQRKLDHDTKLQEFLGIKGQKRILTDLEAREALKKQQQREETERKIQKYQGILNQIREFSGEEDVDKLAARFIKQEEENFALFNYVNELNNELETLQEQVEELKSKIDDQRRVNQQRSEQQQETLSVLNAKLREVCSTADTAKEELQVSSRKLTDLLSGIETVFHLIRCDNSPLLDLLGANAHVTPYNVLLFLGIIERRSNDLLNTVSYLEKKAKKGGDSSKLRTFPVDVVTPTQPGVPCMELQVLENMNKEVISSPFTDEKIKEKLAELNLEAQLHAFLEVRSQAQDISSQNIMTNRAAPGSTLFQLLVVTTVFSPVIFNV
ncbi:outer dynein arm-docking complex subunit 1 [Anabrus simplex]|uniref:outer dynein arm-docking complex subunit 1 n=1 Tax=Anabrus simplex TaxID=316456 RepID=UPI0035A39516